MRNQLEKLGTREFPAKDGVKLYGKLIIYIPIGRDGTIVVNGGGVRIERSSGNPDLDQASIDMVMRAAPFPPLPAKFLSPDRDDVWVIITKFNFTREEKDSH